MTHALATQEAERLADLEVTIAQGLTTFVEVGAALAEIREARLYRETHGTFEDYCRERWGMSRTHANRLVESATVVRNLAPMGATPANERQARALTSVPAKERAEVWKEAVETAPNGKITAAHVAETVKRHKEPNGASAPADKKEEDAMPAVEARRPGPKINVPDDMTVEDLCRRGMAREEDGASTDEAAREIGVSVSIYRRMRYLVRLADRDDLSETDARTARNAVQDMNRSLNTAAAWQLVEPLIERIYGTGNRSGRADVVEANRKAAFDRAYGTLIFACQSAPTIEIPHLPPERLEEIVAELKEAANHVHQLRHHIEEIAR